MRYYEKEHLDAYAQIQREGLDQWNDLHPADSGRGYDDFPSRSFLARILPADPDGGHRFSSTAAGLALRRVSWHHGATACTPLTSLRKGCAVSWNATVSGSSSSHR